jgi:His-Xaa-Ser system radical SAM maturase HxsC
LRLAAYGQAATEFGDGLVARVTRTPLPFEHRADHALTTEDANGQDLAGYAAVLAVRNLATPLPAGVSVPVVHRLETIDHLTDGDVVAVNPTGYVRTVYRPASRHNFLFATDRCNSLCLMCSQPPKEVDDSWRVRELLRTIDLMSPATEELGITGGEPTLLGDGLIEVVRRCKEGLPRTGLHILSNGRLFSYGAYARTLAEVEHPDLMIGIPLYSDIDSEHDHVVQCRGAFDETLLGLYNLGRYGVPIEIRVVVHRLTYKRLAKTAEFIFRNLPFAANIALMGLEPVGLAIPNLDELWIDPWEYRSELEDATLQLASHGMRVSIYNHQLCTLPRNVWSFARQSISDWKNEYLGACGDCSVRERCGGFFSSSVLRRHSSHIRPILLGIAPDMTSQGNL